MRRWALVVCVPALLVGAGLTAANGVPTTFLGDRRTPISADDVKPPACAALDLDAVRAGSGDRGRNALVLGTPGDDELAGGSGDDCLVGGAGNDALRGNAGTDVCIGGPGNDTFHRSCEVRVQ